MALQRERPRGLVDMALLLSQTLVRSYKTHLPDDPFGDDFDDRLEEMKRQLEERERNLIDLGRYSF